MIFDRYRQNYQAQLLLLLILSAILWVMAFIKPTTSVWDETLSPFLFTAKIIIPGKWWSELPALFLVVVEGAMLADMTGRSKLLGRTDLTPAIVYVLLMSYNTHYLSLNEALVNNFLVIALIRTLVNVFDDQKNLLKWLNASLLIGILTLLQPLNGLLLFLLWTTFIIYRINTIREWIVSLLGFFLVALFYYFYLFWFDLISVFHHHLGDFLKEISLSLPQWHRREMPFIFVSIFMMLLLIPRLALLLDENTIKSRKILNVIIFHGFYATLALFLAGDNWPQFFFQLLIPLSIAFSRFLANSRFNKLKDILIIIIFLAVFYERIYPYVEAILPF
jgi:hypothetical protein